MTLKSSFLGSKVIIKHKIFAFLVLSHEGNWWIRAVLGFLFAHAYTHMHTHFLFQSLFDSYKAASLSFLYVTPLHTNIQEYIAQLLWLLPRTGDRIPVLYMTRSFNIS